ncbi:MAG: anti-sigma factor [Proteobacteria bacterium]|nr:anti-sigma factor [Pseudomonadota bacterium]
MSRPISEDDLHAYVDGLLPAARCAEVEAYLARNPEVAERVARFGQQRDALRAALGPVVAEPVPPQLNLGQMVLSRRRSRWSDWRASAAACLLVLAGAGGGWVLRGAATDDRVGIGALAEEANDAYAVFASDLGHPVEIPAADSATLVRWVEDRLARPISLPDLSTAGYRFIGGRVVATGHGPAGLLMYDNAQGSRIAVFMRPMVHADQNAPMARHRRGDALSFAWAENGMGYSLVGGPETATKLHPIADEARRQFRLKS